MFRIPEDANEDVAKALRIDVTRLVVRAVGAPGAQGLRLASSLPRCGAGACCDQVHELEIIHRGTELQDGSSQERLLHHYR